MTAEHDLTGKNSPRRVESYRSGLAHIVPFADVWVRLGDSVTIDRPDHGPLTASGRGGTITGTVVAYSSDRPGFDVAFPVEMQALARLDRERELGQEWTP